MRSSKELARRLGSRRYPEPDSFRRWFGLVVVAGGVGGALIWGSLTLGAGGSQHSPGPLSAGHAAFADRCEECHTPYRPIADSACLSCHAERAHVPGGGEPERTDPACASCHVEHRGAAALLVVSSASCVSCHGALEPSTPDSRVTRDIDSFASHPSFRPLRASREGEDPPRTDPTVLSFNHSVHVGDAELECAECHALEQDGTTMRPIEFELHCGSAECHADALEVELEVGDESVRLAVPHEEAPTVTRWVIGSVVLAGGSASEADPGRVASELKEALYSDEGEGCRLCHDLRRPAPSGQLPAVTPPGIPARWLEGAVFAHRPHAMIACVHCHASIPASERTVETNLPDRGVCQACHVEDAARSAGARCVLCHRYHDTSRAPDLRAERAKIVPVERLAPASREEG